MKRLIVWISGASGVIYGNRLIFNKVKDSPEGFRAAEVGYQWSSMPGREWGRSLTTQCPISTRS